MPSRFQRAMTTKIERPVNSCCEPMADQLTWSCEVHAHRYDCPDALISFTDDLGKDNYGLIVHDGGSASIEIRYCPWCGARLFPPL